MYVTKRNGNKEYVHFDKITSRISKLIKNLDSQIDPALVTQKTCSSMYSGISTTELDNLACQICMGMISDHPDYGILGSRIAISNHQKNTPENFSEVVNILYQNKDMHGDLCSLVSDDLFNISQKYKTELQNIIVLDRDYLLDFFGFKTLERSYLLRINTGNGTKKIIERPQHLFLRVAIGIHGENLELVKETYEAISLKQFTHATPTLFNAGTKTPQLSSCFLGYIEDSIEGIFDSYRECGIISKFAGGIGIHVSDIRSKGSYIRKTGGNSDGLMPLLKTFNSVARQFNQGGKRLGSFAMYLEVFHADIFTFLEAKKNVGSDDERARDLFYALWVCDLFMQKVEKNEDWYLMDPNRCPGLPNVYGEEFNDLYNKYVSDGKFEKKIKARDLWEAIIASQIEHGMPYICYKDHVNRKSNQKNLGTIRSSNLCVSGETMILTKDGYFPIKTLENQMVQIWNGKEWSRSLVKKTGENQKLLTVNFSNGMTLKCTEYHKFFIETGSRPADKSKPIIIEAKDLKPKMKIIRYNLPNDVTNNFEEMKHPYTHGFYCGDGTDSNKKKKMTRCSYKCKTDSDFCGYHQNNEKLYFDETNICKSNCHMTRPLLSLYHDKNLLKEHIVYDTEGSFDPELKKVTLCLPYEMESKYTVPINKGINTKIKWLEGYLDADGCVVENDGIKNIQVVSIHKVFLDNVFLMLQTLGIQTVIGLGGEEENKLLPDGKGGKKLYNCKKRYRLNIDALGVIRLKELGFTPKRLDISDLRPPHHKTNKYTTVLEVVDNNDIEDTYCFNEPKEHKGIFNGIITSNCAEINLYSDVHETAVCNLSSICLPSILESPNAKDITKHLPWHNLLSEDEKILSKYFLLGKLKLFTKKDCDYCKLLKALLKKSNFKFDEIDEKEAERLRLISNPASSIEKPFETVPQLFSVLNSNDIQHLGGYDDCWKILQPRINYTKLEKLSYNLVLNLNKVIDINYYPVEKTRVSNMKHRPLGIGVQGLANVFMMLRLPFTSEESRKINKNIFETIYWGAIRGSVDMAKKDGCYSTFKGSPMSEGKFQFDLWDLKEEDLSGMWNWDEMRREVLEHGVRNSVLVSLMPTASTASIFGNVESFEPVTSNLYTRNVLSGVFTIINKHLISDLIDLELWNKDMTDQLIYYKGSVQNISGLPKKFKEIYKTVFEIDQKLLIKMAAERSPFICQSQSLNLFFDKPSFKDLTSSHFLGWKLGLKTGSYYIRTKAAASGQNFGMDVNKEKMLKKIAEEEEEKECINCSA